MLFAGSLPATPFRALVDAAAAAGFDAISLWPLMYRRACRREGLDPPTMRAILDDVGLRVTELDACGDWLPPPSDAVYGPRLRSRWERREFFDAACELGADTVVAAHLTGGPVDQDAAVEGFAQLCDDAARHGLCIALEFVPFTGIPDAARAWRIIEESGRANAGLVVDLAHVVRSGGDEGPLRKVPADRIFTVQLADGPAAPPDDLLDEAQWHRADPGDGDFDVAGRLARLAAEGVRARVGPELYRAGWSERDPRQVAADLYAATRRVLP